MDKSTDMRAAHRAFAESCGTEHHGMKPTMNPRGGGNFIAGAIKHPGALHRDLGVPQGKRIPPGAIAAAASRPGVVGRRARFAQTLAKLRK